MEVNLKQALDDPRERLIIQPADLVLLKYTAPEMLGNVLLNIVNVTYRVGTTTD
jgi:hypothetical protein